MRHILVFRQIVSQKFCFYGLSTAHCRDTTTHWYAQSEYLSHGHIQRRSSLHPKNSMNAATTQPCYHPWPMAITLGCITSQLPFTNFDIWSYKGYRVNILITCRATNAFKTNEYKKVLFTTDDTSWWFCHTLIRRTLAAFATDEKSLVLSKSDELRSLSMVYRSFFYCTFWTFHILPNIVRLVLHALSVYLYRSNIRWLETAWGYAGMPESHTQMLHHWRPGITVL